MTLKDKIKGAKLWHFVCVVPFVYFRQLSVEDTKAVVHVLLLKDSVIIHPAKFVLFQTMLSLSTKLIY